MQAINLLVVIRHFDREDLSFVQGQPTSLARQSGRIFYEGRSGERKDFGGELMLSMNKSQGQD